MSKMILILIMGAFISYGIINITSNDNLTQSTENAADNYSLTKARNIANSTAEMIFSNLGDNINWRVNSPVTEEYLNGEVTYKVEDAFFNGDSLIKISILGNYFNNLKSVTIYTARDYKSPGSIPPGVKGAITTDNDVQTHGTLTVDGRNHSMAGNLIPQQGTFGIWTTNQYEHKGNSTIGGTYYNAGTGTDIEPTKTGYTPVVGVTQTYQDGFPDTPEKVLGGTSKGYSEDKLKEIAKLGLNGSQYVTNPASLTYPLKGITYVELPPAGVWLASSIEGSGIMIIHNKTKNAVIKNLNSGVFRGLIIADDIIHIQSVIIGAIVSLTNNPSEGNTIGNGTGIVKFSKEAITSGTGFATTHNFGFRAKRVDVKYWFE